MPDDEREQIIAILTRRGHLGVVACVELQRAIGLRATEAIMAGDSLRTWQKALNTRRPVHIVYGTKGGRARDVCVADVERAKLAVAAAIDLSERQSWKLVDRANLKTAMSHYREVMHNSGATGKHSGHALRYAFASDQMTDYLADEMTASAALSTTSQDLGMGMGAASTSSRCICGGG